MIQFYSPDIETNPFLPEDESVHCCRVLRMNIGDEIYVTDGKGTRYKCLIEDNNPRKTKLRIVEKEEFAPLPYTLTLAVAPTKNSDRMEWMVEKAVEIGVERIVLLRCEHSERKFMKGERLKKIMVAAMKQSLSVRLPHLEELMDYDKFVSEVKAPGTQKFFGYCSESYPRKEFVKECKGLGEIIVMIGPEGDFSPMEVCKAVENGYCPVTFGEKRLRTETAGVFVACAVNTLNQLL